MDQQAIADEGADRIMRMLPDVISIDPPTARDLDDAIACERLAEDGWIVDVCVPDIPGVISAGSPEDLSAEHLGITTYAATGIRQAMLGNGAERLGLSSAHDRPMIHFRFEVSPDLIAKASSVSRVTHRTTASMTYAQADLALADTAHPHHAAMSALWDLARRLHEERAAATGAAFDVAAKIYTDEDGQRRRLDETTAHRSNMIVMEMMVLANSALARHAAENDLPVIYRNFCLKGFKNGDRRSAAAELARREGIGRNVAFQRLRSMAHELGQAELGTTVKGHHALDVPAYAWFTSPLRRYVDIVNLRALLGAEKRSDLEALASRLNGVYLQQKQSSSEHHGRASRRRIIMDLAKGRLQDLEQWDLHTIVKALTENPGFDRMSAMRLVADRMVRDELSGKDIQSLVDGADALFGSEGQATVSAWLDDGSRRQRLTAHLEGRPTVEPLSIPAVNHKGALLEKAARTGAVVDFSTARRRGPVHEPLFEVSASWRHRGVEKIAQGSGRTVKSAENAAAGELLFILEEDVVAPAKPASATSNPKGLLLEVMTATKGASAIFGSADMTGPPHAPTFSVPLKVVMDGRKLDFVGTGRSRKEAERNASLKALEHDLIGKER